MATFEINGKPHDLYCGLNEHQGLWKLTGKNLLVGENVVAGITPGNIAQVVHLMIRGAVSIEDVVKSLDRTRRLVEALKVVAETINDGLEDATAAEQNPS